MTFAGWLRSDDAGAVAVITAICCLLLFGVAALAVDIGTEYEVRRQSQSAADLAALAGALYLPRQPALACQAALANLKDNTPKGQAPGDVDDPSACDGTTGNTADGQVSITNDATVVTVTTPVKIVQFGLAGAVFTLTYRHKKIQKRTRKNSFCGTLGPVPSPPDRLCSGIKHQPQHRVAVPIAENGRNSSGTLTLF